MARVAAPVLTRTTIAPLSGLIESLDEREEGARLVVRVARFGTMPAAERPARVRVSFKKAPPLRPGDFITATARLLPPPEAARPGGYDFARDAYFRGIGAVGSLLGQIAVNPPPEPVPWSLRLAAAVDDARNALTRRITDANGGQAGAVAAALVTGKRGLIAPATNDTLRAAGIYHVVSISGLHMVLAAGVVFWLVRAGLALVPFLALVWPIKKIAAALAMVGVTAYCVFSGWDIAAERSLVMTLIMLGAILVDRPALSMRNLALAALIALAHEPDGLLGPSFQMSFGAVAGLIACAPLIDGRLFRRDGAGRIGRVIALGPGDRRNPGHDPGCAGRHRALRHLSFPDVQPFGLVGNALTLPLVSLAVMPAAVIGMPRLSLRPRPADLVADGPGGGRHAGHRAGSPGSGGPTSCSLPSGPSRSCCSPPVSCSRRCRSRACAGSPCRPCCWASARGAAGSLRHLRRSPGRRRRRARTGRPARGLGRPSGFVLEQWLKADGDGRRPGALAAPPAAGMRPNRMHLAPGRTDGRSR